MQAKCISLSRYLFARLVQLNKRLISLPENAKVGPGLDILVKDWLDFKILKSSFHSLVSHRTLAKVIQRTKFFTQISRSLVNAHLYHLTESI